ncbi:MAG TPA: DUF5691 domain-containing protein [Actinospica sp.]|nr:DUF5691 domain-containing protein [Actinospica sp.]
MTTWNELVSAALVGTERHALVPDPALAEADPARALLKQAMLLAVPALTGAPPAPHEGALPEPAPTDDRPLIPSSGRLRLRAVLDVHPKYLPEWLAATRASGCRLPLAALPPLLDAGRNSVALRNDLAEVLGAPGHWLARQNPDWRYLLREPFGPLRPEDWDGPDPDARIAYVNGLYAADPAAARALLQAAWPTQTAAQKMSLLAVVTRHAAAADLDFVRTLSKDSSKQVRDEAKSIEGQITWREDQAEDFTTKIRELIDVDGIGNSVYHFAVRRPEPIWPLDGCRLLLAALVVTGRGGGAPHWAAQHLIGLLADRAPTDLLPEARTVAQTIAAETAAGTEHRLDFDPLATQLGFRADLHAELTASASAAAESGQE